MSLRVLFASVHGHLDPSSGAALATRDILELLASRGHECRVVSTGLSDFEREMPLREVLGTLGVPYDVGEVRLASSDNAVEVFDLTLAGVRATLLPTKSSRQEKAPDRDEGMAFLDLGVQALERFHPNVLLTYGGHPASLELMRQARRRGVAVVFHLHNFGYDDLLAFADATAVLVPSEYSRRHHARLLGMDATVIPYPLRRARIVAENPEPKYLTFVNPQPAKGVAVVARIAGELARRRPDIPLLIVEGRAKAPALGSYGVDLSGAENLHFMENTPDPRDIYRASRALLVPSLWRESFGRVAAEAMANGLPVLASDRGALPETLGDAGFVFTVPTRTGPAGGTPTVREVAPWLAIIERLWDDPTFEKSHRERARIESERWDEDRIASHWESLMGRL